jgi:hypothetical protein
MTEEFTLADDIFDAELKTGRWYPMTFSKLGMHRSDKPDICTTFQLRGLLGAKQFTWPRQSNHSDAKERWGYFSHNIKAMKIGLVPAAIAVLLSRVQPEDEADATAAKREIVLRRNDNESAISLLEGGVCMVKFKEVTNEWNGKTYKKLEVAGFRACNEEEWEELYDEYGDDRGAVDEAPF